MEKLKKSKKKEKYEDNFIQIEFNIQGNRTSHDKICLVAEASGKQATKLNNSF